MPHGDRGSRPALTPADGADVRDGRLQFPADDPGQFGERKQRAAFQQAGGGGVGGQGQPQPSPTNQQGITPSPQDVFPDVFGPSQRPAEPVSETGESILPPDPDLALRALYRKFPHPDILRLIQRTRA